MAGQGLAQDTKQAIQGPPETAPPQNPLNDAYGGNRLRHISSTAYQRTLIFSASGLYGFCSSAFPESLLLNRKSLSENFRLKMQISRRRPAFKNLALGRDF
jgi:hypothetical protein